MQTDDTDDLIRIVNTRLHKKENFDKWNRINVSLDLSSYEEDLKLMIMNFFSVETNKKDIRKLYCQIMSELDIQCWL